VATEASGKFKITADFNGTPTTDKAEILVRCGPLEHDPVQVRWEATMPNRVDQDANSEVYSLVTPATGKTWNVAVKNPAATTWARLHPTTKSASAFPGSGFFEQLSSAAYSNVYLHVGLSTGRVATLTVHSIISGESTVERVAISQ
jgi:hypothetical protein